MTADPTFTTDELHAAFVSVANSLDWRKPICRTVTVESDRDTQCIVAAIDALAGGGATYSTYTRRDGRRTLTVRAPGYDAMVHRKSTEPHITLQCTTCDTLSRERIPDAETCLLLSVQWSANGFGRIAFCASCAPAKYAAITQSKPAL
jgi:hypothetical protein